MIFGGPDIMQKDREDNPIKRYYAKLTRKSAINAMCGHCMRCTAKEKGYSEDDWIEPGFRKEIRNCSALSCPLWEFRPYQMNDYKQQRNVA